MNAELIKKWNEKVPKNGTVFHLGDFAWRGYYYWKKIREQLNGKIHLILGNHDLKNGPKTKENFLELFETVSQQERILIENRSVYLNHYPFLCYGGVYRDNKSLVYQLFGHVHSGENQKGLDIPRLEMLFPTQYDVGIDNNDYAPCSWAEVKAKIEEQISNAKKEKK
jgi:calcineurin-like phosphoesterase family protein